MGEVTKIAWTDHTFNPWWGCARVSPGCLNCYAEAFAKRTGNDVWGKESDRRFFGDKHWNEPLKWNAAAEKAGVPALVFCASMADVFEDRDDLIEHRMRLFNLMVSTPWLIWQVLTKRPENVLRMVPTHWQRPSVYRPVGDEGELLRSSTSHPCWPSNVWIGTTVEDQQRADERIPLLLKIPAPVRFLSCEPLLGVVDLSAPGILCTEGVKPQATANLAAAYGAVNQTMREAGERHLGKRFVDWVIVGGESGPKHRPFNPDWARVLWHQCFTGGVPFFFKQHGGLHPTSGGDLLDDRQIKQLPELVAPV